MYNDKASKNSVQHVARVWPAVEFELILRYYITDGPIHFVYNSHA